MLKLPHLLYNWLMNDVEIKTIRDWLQTGSINIFGMPFSGKDTHGHELSKMFNAPLIGGGDILRSSKGPKHIQEHIGKGHLAPSDEYLAIVLPYLERAEFNGRPLILSTVGRWHGEESSVLEAAKKSGHSVKAVIYLSITEDEARKRWMLANRQRDDDAEHILETRFKEFHDKTLPVVEYYRDLGLLIEVDGIPARQQVTDEIFLQLAALAKSQ